jgi:hypothetical protein
MLLIPGWFPLKMKGLAFKKGHGRCNQKLYLFCASFLSLLLSLLHVFIWNKMVIHSINPTIPLRFYETNPVKTVDWLYR